MAETKYEVKHEQRQCDAGQGFMRCTNFVTHWAQPEGYTGPVYCRDHASMAVLPISQKEQ